MEQPPVELSNLSGLRPEPWQGDLVRGSCICTLRVRKNPLADAHCCAGQPPCTPVVCGRSRPAESADDLEAIASRQAALPRLSDGLFRGVSCAPESFSVQQGPGSWLPGGGLGAKPSRTHGSLVKAHAAS